MREALQYPLDVPLLLRKRRALKAELSAQGPFMRKKIALLGGSTTADLRSLLELFLLASGIEPVFFESEYNRFFEDGALSGSPLDEFGPDVVVVHTTQRNVTRWPEASATPEQVDALLASELGRFELLWKRLLSKFSCVVVQNNFDAPPLEVLGHLGSSAPSGHVRFVERLNAAFAEAARAEPRLRINDIARLSAQVGLDEWASPAWWLNYKMAVSPAGAARLAHQTAKIIRAAYGRTKKCLVLDLDNTLWGGVIGDDGVDGLELGHETPRGEAFVAFQRYCLQLKSRGVLLAVCSKNDPAVARTGFLHPDSVLKVSDFAAFHASWDPKPDGLVAIARQLNLGLDALVFVDDNPFERELVSRALPEVAVPKVSDPARYAEVVDREGHFEPFSITQDDATRAEQYATEALRVEAQARFQDYGEYLQWLEMKAEIAPFAPKYLDRIAQLINKTNQFNLTTSRHSLAEVTAFAKSPEHVTLYGRLADRFGDHGLVSVIIAHALGEALHVDTWLMSCRVLKRDFEHAMFAALCEAAQKRGIVRLIGRYVPTPKNAMVAGHYESLGFTRLDDGTWSYELGKSPAPKSTPITRSLKEP